MPLYRQLMQQVQRLAAAGELREGDVLPSVRELSRDLGVNPSTVVKAYAELERTGLVETRHGLGTFVSRNAGLQRARRMQSLHETAEQLMIEAHHLGLSEQDVHEAVAEAAEQLRSERKRSER
jgi:GntR family transcriptional regulator